MPEFENDFDGTEEASTEAVDETIAEEMAAEVLPEGSAALNPVPGHPEIDGAVADLGTVEGDVVEDDDEDEEDAEEDSEDDFFAESEVAAIPDVDPAKVVTVRTSQGTDVYVETETSLPLVDVIAKSGLRFNGDFTCWLNGQEVGLGTVVSGGTTVTVVGSVKGGRR